MTAVPMQNYVLCEQVSGFDEEVQDRGVFVKKETMKEYKILSISSNAHENSYAVGDIVLCNSTGTRFVIDDKTLFLFNIDNIAGVIK